MASTGHPVWFLLFLLLPPLLLSVLTRSVKRFVSLKIFLNFKVIHLHSILKDTFPVLLIESNSFHPLEIVLEDRDNRCVPVKPPAGISHPPDQLRIVDAPLIVTGNAKEWQKTSFNSKVGRSHFKW